MAIMVGVPVIAAGLLPILMQFINNIVFPSDSYKF